MSEYAKFVEEVRAEAKRSGLMVWEDIPAQVPLVDLPEGSTAKDLCQTALKLGLDLIYVYLDDDEGEEIAIAGFAKHGIFHRVLLAAPPQEDDDEDDDDDDDLVWRPWSGHLLVSYEDLDEAKRVLVDAVVAHPEYDPRDHRHETEVLNEVLADLDDDDYGVLKDVAESRFDEKLESSLETAANRAAARLIKDDGFDPLWDRDAMEQWVQDQRPDLETRGVRRTASALQHLAMTTGAWEAAREELVGLAREVLSALPATLRDRLGFTTRNAARAAMLEPYLAAVPEQRRDQIVYWVCRTESEEHGMLRERRYATAAAILMDDHGEKKSAVGRILGLSSSVVERIHREYPVRIDISGDEVLGELDPRLT